MTTAAAMARTPADRAAARRAHRLTVLTAGDLGVRAAIDTSYRRLDDASAQMFRFTALIPAPKSGVDVAAVAAGQDPATALRAVETLVDAGLLGSIGVRYRRFTSRHISRRY